MGISVDLDFLLVQKMRLGDEQAFDQFVSKYYPAILKYCRLHIQDNGYAEDMTQETFTRFFRTLPQYKHYGKAANYLYVLASNICKDYYKKEKEVLMENLSFSALPVAQSRCPPDILCPHFALNRAIPPSPTVL